MRFDNLQPNDKSLTEKEKQDRLIWLSRGLFEAVCAFINQAKGAGWGLRAALYELDQADVLKTFKASQDNGADVKIVYESRKAKDKKTGKLKDNTQTRDNKKALTKAGFKINDKNQYRRHSP